jgi:hypothetical protein
LQIQKSFSRLFSPSKQVLLKSVKKLLIKP